jgi:hypothetical protein
LLVSIEKRNRKVFSDLNIRMLIFLQVSFFFIFETQIIMQYNLTRPITPKIIFFLNAWFDGSDRNMSLKKWEDSVLKRSGIICAQVDGLPNLDLFITSKQPPNQLYVWLNNFHIVDAYSLFYVPFQSKVWDNDWFLYFVWFPFTTVSIWI